LILFASQWFKVKLVNQVIENLATHLDIFASRRSGVIFSQKGRIGECQSYLINWKFANSAGKFATFKIKFATTIFAP
jgi:hypothetical protein